ncbi:N-6 DNA methylase [Leptolyngbya sp. PL-A3]|uniref:restriction endonuclease subunit M n=1 Tax=Leptolyngbya sp. PL-A3 TaxID=2933911 RepID=UPI00329716C2
MTDFDDENLTAGENENDEVSSGDEENPEEFIIDILTGEFIKLTSNNKSKVQLVQRVLHQLINSFGFSRHDLKRDYNPRISGNRTKIDIAIFRPGTEHINDNIHRIVICKPQKQRGRLRTPEEAASDLEPLKRLMEALPECRFGIWTNGFEDFYLQAEHDRFETRFTPLGVLPAPGEDTEAVNQTGGPIQVPAESEDLKDVLERCYRYLRSLRGYNQQTAFQPLAILLFAKLYDETCQINDRQFWVRGSEPFVSEGQDRISQRINSCLRDAEPWQPNILSRSWRLNLAPNETAQVVKELSKYSLSQTHPLDRTFAYRSIVRMVMDGVDGRYPTPLNVARMVVQILDPKPNERILDCACGTGTFLTVAAAHLFDHFLAETGTDRQHATSSQMENAQTRMRDWAAQYAFGCEKDPDLAVTARLNMLLTSGNPGRIFHLNSLLFPNGDFDGVEPASSAIQLGTADIVVVNPRFSTRSTDIENDRTILQSFELGKIWERTEDGNYRNTGNLREGGVPPEVLFLERAVEWVKPGTGRVGILLPNGLLGNPGDEAIRWWILQRCEVLASIELPLEPFKVTVNQYRLSPALPSFLVLRRRSIEELMQLGHAEYSVFMAVAEKGGVNSRGKPIFKRAANGEIIVVTKDVVERIRLGERVITQTERRREFVIHDELPEVAERFHLYAQDREIR